jgi:hypothetical protein
MALILPITLGSAVMNSVLEGLASVQRGNTAVQSHFRYSRWQSSHPTMGEYQSRPHASVERDTVKFCSVWMRESWIWVGSVWVSCMGKLSAVGGERGMA